MWWLAGGEGEEGPGFELDEEGEYYPLNWSEEAMNLLQEISEIFLINMFAAANILVVMRGVGSLDVLDLVAMREAARTLYMGMDEEGAAKLTMMPVGRGRLWLSQGAGGVRQQLPN